MSKILYTGILLKCSSFVSWEKCKNKNDNIIKTRFKISDDQTNIDKYRLAANITEYHIILKLILQRIIITNFCGPVSH